MKNASFVVETPAGKCKTTQRARTYVKNGFEMLLSLKREERSFGDMTVCEIEKLKTQKRDGMVSILKVNSMVENGFEKKIVEYAKRQVVGGRVEEKRHKRIKAQGRTIFDTFEIRNENCSTLKNTVRGRERVFKGKK